ncbi:12290_t:CDS:2 [Acaulospora colombiana]|uniref:12290_t:CDS:1 n=1 Tax=Acaulospora colombiana TaxID=27376 RepID=A0ACA9L8B4_9GLOM|nr:12290_t:CDS:2 [Acaulospora colombiana]
MSKRETDVSSPAPKRKSIRIARQESLAGATSNLRICSGSNSSARSSYDLKDLPSSASKFALEDVEALNATFESTSNENDVIPEVESENYIVKEDFTVGTISGTSDRHVKGFISKLHRVVVNASLDIGMDESKTGSLVTQLLTSIVDFNIWPLEVRVKECYRLSVSDKRISARPEFVVDLKEVVMIVVEDKHLNNVSAPDFGEAQILAEILACGYENVRLSITDQTILAVSIISSYVTFYKAEHIGENLRGAYHESSQLQF